MRVARRLSRVIKGTISRPMRCLALAGMTFGAVAFWLLTVIVGMALRHPELASTLAPLVLYSFLSVMLLLALIVATFLGFRNLEVGASTSGVSLKTSKDAPPSAIPYPTITEGELPR